MTTKQALSLLNQCGTKLEIQWGGNLCGVSALDSKGDRIYACGETLQEAALRLIIAVAEQHSRAYND